MCVCVRTQEAPEAALLDKLLLHEAGACVCVWTVGPTPGRYSLKKRGCSVSAEASPGTSLNCCACGKEPTCQRRRCKRLGFDPWIGKIPWRRKWKPTPVFLPGESCGQRSLTGNSP